MSRKRQKEKVEKVNTEEEAPKNTGQTLNEKLPTQTFDDYQCTGNVKIDFPRLCALLDIKDIPAVSTRQEGSSNNDNEGAENEVNQSHSNAHWSKPRLQVELENEDPLSAKSLKISGWRVDEPMSRVLQRMLPSLSKLQSLHSVTLEGNFLPKQSYHLLLSEDSVLTHLSLRNNQMGDEGARLIGSALSTTRSANKNLRSLNLSFNSIGDAGAKYIAQGLRYNRALLFLSLSNNWIGDAGAADLATILRDFALTHEEVVERRKLQLERAQLSLQSSFVLDSDRSPSDQLPSVPSSSSLSSSKGKKKETNKKAEKPAATKENPKLNKKSSDVKVSQSKGSKPGGKEKQPPLQEVPEVKSSTSLIEQMEETINPLLDQSVQYKEGKLFLPGNTTLVSLNLAGNKITEKSLPLFLKLLQMQSEGGGGRGGGLLRLCLQRNSFPSDCKYYVKIKELIKLVDPLEKNNHEPTEEEGQKS
ncbi:leucine-rich repeat-containing protein 71 [Xyrichtys novacula]|uniref:Leucine-rich repeat-containing protein 71 n=1 Tax=Xyrichtys novacula TaxID=13765 RepID=A0AAV1HB76_XYRNO|nr:leucine-rich repeat-containing protein 71 [Xyrichtys novacula]